MEVVLKDVSRQNKIVVSGVGGSVRRGSPWWEEIARIMDEVCEAAERGWFEEGVVRWVGNGMETLFWSNPWLGGVPLSVRF
jgi:hypothetical protein